LTDAFDSLLVDAYTAAGLLDRSGTAVHLPTECPNHAKCWEGVDGSRVPPIHDKDNAGRLSAPWIGARYQQGRLALLLENLRDYGGWDLRAEAEKGMRYLGSHARDGFANGDRVLFRGGGYAGTKVWAQAVSYAATWLSGVGRLPTTWEGDRVPGTALAETMDLITMVQHVKCSPRGHRSNATAAMWSECGRHILRRELEVLQPERIIVIGSNNNARALADHVLPEGQVVRGLPVKLRGKTSTVRLEQRTLAGRPIEVIVVQHPASPGGTARALIGAVHHLVHGGTSATSTKG